MAACIVRSLFLAALVTLLACGRATPTATLMTAPETEECDSPFQTHYYGEIDSFTVSIDESVHACDSSQVIIVRPKKYPIYNYMVGHRQEYDGKVIWERLYHQDGPDRRYGEREEFKNHRCSALTDGYPYMRSAWGPCFGRSAMLSLDEALIVQEELDRMMVAIRKEENRMSELEVHERIWGPYGNRNYCW